MRSTGTAHVVLLLAAVLALTASCKREDRIWLYEPGGTERFDRELRSGDPWERRLATLQIAGWSGGSARHLPVLLAAVRDGSPGEREAAYAALRVYGERGAEAVPALIEDLRSGPPSLRATAAVTLASVGGSRRDEAEPVLLAALLDPDARVRAVVGIALARIRGIVIVLSPSKREPVDPWRCESVRARLRADGVLTLRLVEYDLESLRDHLRERADTLRDPTEVSGVTLRLSVHPDAAWIRVRAILQICADRNVLIHRIGLGNAETWSDTKRHVVVVPDPPPLLDLEPPTPTSGDGGPMDDMLDDVPPPMERLPPILEDGEPARPDHSLSRIPEHVIRVTYDTPPVTAEAIEDRLREIPGGDDSWLGLEVHPSVPAGYVLALLDRLTMAGRHRIMFIGAPRESPTVVTPPPDRDPGLLIE